MTRFPLNWNVVKGVFYSSGRRKIIISNYCWNKTVQYVESWLLQVIVQDITKVDLWLFSKARKHENDYLLTNSRQFYFQMTRFSLFVYVYCIKKIFKQKFLSKTVVHAIITRLLSRLKKFQRNRINIFLVIMFVSCP